MGKLKFSEKMMMVNDNNSVEMKGFFWQHSNSKFQKTLKWTSGGAFFVNFD